MSPELAQRVATAHGHLSAATGSARAALTSGQARIRGLLDKLQGQVGEGE